MDEPTVLSEQEDQLDSKLKNVKKSSEKISEDRQLRAELKKREYEQTQELLVSLTNELYEKIEKLDSPKEKPRFKKSNIKKDSKPKKTTKTLNGKNEYFSDLSWYRNKLGE